MKYLISLNLLLISCAAFADGEEELTPIWQQGTVIVIQAISLLILIFVLYKFLFKPISESLETRQKEIADAYSEAEEQKKNYEDKLADLDNMIKHVDEEVEEKLKQAIKDANAIKDKKIEEANMEIRRKTELAENNIMNEKEKALTELKGQTGALGVQIASKILKEELTPQKHESLINTFIKDLDNEA